jgi:hypothetical protein
MICNEVTEDQILITFAGRVMVNSRRENLLLMWAIPGNTCSHSKLCRDGESLGHLKYLTGICCKYCLLTKSTLALSSGMRIRNFKIQRRSASEIRWSSI